MGEAVALTAGPASRWPAAWSVARAVALASAIAVTGTTMAYLLASGLWYLALALLLALPGFVLLNRVPLSAVAVWLLIAPYVLLTSGVVRYGFWLVHRGLPVVVLVVLVASRAVGFRTRPLGRLGGPELLMLAYVGFSVMSIGYTSAAAGTALIALYDRVVIPMCLYAVVRLAQPSSASLQWLVPVAAITVVAQTTIGALSWVAPETLPTDWLGRAGSRTIGSLSSPSVYGVTILAAGAFLLHAAATQQNRAARITLRALFGLSVLMAVLTFTRGVWLAAIVVVAAVAVVHPRSLGRVALVAAPLILVAALSGAGSGQITTIEQRFNSEDTALSRLPIALASWRMFEAKPLTGWGFGNFDEFDLQFNGEVDGVVPEKDHASHNVYLTLLAEQGLVGTLLFLGPAIWLLARTGAVFSRLPRSGFANRKLVVLLWALLLAHVTVNNFSNMRVVFGLGQWWLILGLIAVLVSIPTAGERDVPSTLRSRSSW